MKSYQLLFFLVFVLFKNSFVYSQKEINHFAFFDKLEMDFNAINTQLKPTALARRILYCSSTISDSNGNLLFYTNNNKIWNKNHQIMLYGDDVGGQVSFATPAFPAYRSLSCVIVPKPGAAGKYLVISTADGSNSFNLNCSEVDMSLDGGNGALINKNRLFYIGTDTESLSAVRQKNSDNVWLISKISQYDIAAFLITPTGISPPIISNFYGENINQSRMNDIEFSPDGKKIVLGTLAGTSDFIGVLDFNSDTGIMSNYTELNTGYYSDADFSPSGRFLYVFHFDRNILDLLQYDINNMGNPPYVVGHPHIGSSFLGANGKIYGIENISGTNEQRIIVINEPELLGASCDYKQTNIKTTDFIDFRAKYLKSFALNPSKVETCTNSNTVLYANSMNTINSVTWDFGDGSTASGQNPTHNYANPGVYYASAVVNTSNGIENILKTVVVYGLFANSVPEQYICIDSGGSLIDLSQFESTILGTQSPLDFGVSYFSNIQDANTNSSKIDPNVTITQDVSYFARVYNKNDLFQTCYAIAEIKFHAYVKPLLAIQDKYYLCENSSVVLNSASGFDHYLWSTGATTQSITATSPGIYTVTVKDDHPNVSCETAKNIEVISSNKATIVNIDISDFTAGNNSFLVLVSGSGDYQYSMDGIHYQDSNAFSGLGSGEFMVYVKDKNGCGISQESVFLLSYPSFFTPNGDGFNDVWSIKYSNSDPNLTISIFDRYGKLIKVLSGVNSIWDGTLNGAMLPSTDYWFVAKRGNGKTVKGHFSLKR